MTDVSTWAAIDDNNNTPSPAGWPEGMMPAGVNNCGRMMMGALRREHDRIVGQVGSTAGAITTTGNITAGGNLAAIGGVTGANASFSGALGATSIHAAGDITGDYNIHVLGNVIGDLSLSTGGTVSATFLRGGHSDAGTLRTYGSINDVCFNWISNRLHYRINDTLQYAITTNTNANALAYASGMGGPTGIGLIGYDYGGSSYVSYVDSVSDARIKERIEPSEVDALGVIQGIPVSRFDIKPAAAAWLGTVGKGDAVRTAAMLDPQREHVPIGFVAQHLARHVAEAVHVVAQPVGTGSPLPSDLHTIRADALVPYLVRAVQQMAERIEQLETALIK